MQLAKWIEHQPQGKLVCMYVCIYCNSILWCNVEGGCTCLILGKLKTREVSSKQWTSIHEGETIFKGANFKIVIDLAIIAISEGLPNEFKKLTINRNAKISIFLLIYSIFILNLCSFWPPTQPNIYSFLLDMNIAFSLK